MLVHIALVGLQYWKLPFIAESGEMLFIAFNLISEHKRSFGANQMHDNAETQTRCSKV